MAVCGLLAACNGQSSIKPAEMLDEATGMTVGALASPLEFVQSIQSAGNATGNRSSFAYLGPAEWDEMGHYTYGLWLHVAPGNDRQVADIRKPAAVSMILDDGAMVLVPIDAPKPGHNPYKPVAPWGQSSYFSLDESMLKRMAASTKLDLNIVGVDGSTVVFQATHDNRNTLAQFAKARGITLD